jgi:hypothetical protein
MSQNAMSEDASELVRLVLFWSGLFVLPPPRERKPSRKLQFCIFSLGSFFAPLQLRTFDQLERRLFDLGFAVDFEFQNWRRRRSDKIPASQALQASLRKRKHAEGDQGMTG